MKKRRWALLTLLLFLLNLVPLGCYDYNEIDETAYVVVLGLDKGKENKLTITARIAVPRNMAGGGMGATPAPAGGKPSEVVSVEAPSVMGGINMLVTFLSRRISLDHTKAVVFSEELAREGILPYLSVLGRNPELRRNIIVGVARGNSAKETLEKSMPVLESNPAKYVELNTLVGRFTAFTPLQTQFHYFYTATHLRGADPDSLLLGLGRKTTEGEGPKAADNNWKSEGSYLPGEIPRSGGNTVEVIGAALFKGDKLVDEIDGDELTALMILRNSLNRTDISLPDPETPDQMVSLNLHQHRPPHFKIDVSDTIPKISIGVVLEGSVVGIQSHNNYEDPRYRPVLEAAAAEWVRNDIVKLLKRTQDLGVDSAWIGERAKVHFLTDKDWEDYNWKAVYPEAQIELNVKVDLRTFGLTRESAPAVK